MVENLLRPLHMDGYELKNRVIALPLFTGYARPDGRVSPLMMEHYSRIAGSGAAMVVIGNVAVSSDGATSRSNLRIHADEFIPGLSRLAGAIRNQGALACLQLNHGGPFAKNGKPMVPSPVDGATLFHDIGSLRSFMETFPVKMRFGLTRQLMEMACHWQRGMTDAERRRVAAGFAEGAHRARQAGFDMVELHGATGYLLASYLSGYTNKIESGYGGSIQERAAFPLEVLRAVKQRLPKGFPVGFRLMIREWVPGGVDISEAVAFARILADAGAAYISVSAGTYSSMFKAEVLRVTARPAHLAKDTAVIRSSVSCPVILAGRLFSPRVAESVLGEGQADMVGLARALLADERWLEKAAAKEKIIVCINCNNCLKRVVLDAGVTCVRWPEAKKERIDIETAILSRNLPATLIVAASRRDLERIRAAWETCIFYRWDVRVRFLFLRGRYTDDGFDAAVEGFLEWARGVSPGRPDYEIRSAYGFFEDAVMEEVEKGGFGSVVLPGNPDEPWRKRLASRHKTGALSLPGPHPHPEKVIVPVDLTTMSLLLLRAVQDACYGRPEMDVTFVHILVGDDDAGAAQKRWREILDILGWDADTALQIIPGRQKVAGDLMETIRRDGYGAIIMGRRRMTSLGEWILGRVSAGVMEKITDRSITLIG